MNRRLNLYYYSVTGTGISFIINFSQGPFALRLHTIPLPSSAQYLPRLPPFRTCLSPCLAMVNFSQEWAAPRLHTTRSPSSAQYRLLLPPLNVRVPLAMLHTSVVQLTFLYLVPHAFPPHAGAVKISFVCVLVPGLPPHSAPRSPLHPQYERYFQSLNTQSTGSKSSELEKLLEIATAEILAVFAASSATDIFERA